MPIRCALNQSTVCRVLGIGSKSLTLAGRILRHGDEDLIASVRSGHRTLAEAIRELPTEHLTPAEKAARRAARGLPRRALRIS